MIINNIENWPEEMINSNLEDNPEDWSEFCAPGTSYYQHRIAVSNDVSLRLISFKPEIIKYKMPILFMPGLVSVMMSFKHMILELNKYFIVHYLETREKPSSIVKKGSKFDIESIANDIVAAVSIFGFKESKYLLIGASLSATAIIHSYKKLNNKPFCLGLLEPNAAYPYPKWGLMLIKILLFFQRDTSEKVFSAKNLSLTELALKSMVLWYMKNFRMNTKEDYEMFEISSRALASADPYRLRRTVLGISSYQIWDRLEEIDTAVFMVGASSDTFHRHDDLAKMAQMIEDCTYLDLVNHKRTYGKDFAQNFMSYINKIDAAILSL